MDVSEPHAANFLSVVHRIIGIRSRLLVTVPPDIKRLKSDLLGILSNERGGGVDFANFLSLGIALSHNEDGLTMSEIGRVLSVPQSTATRVVDGMVDAGHLQRAADAADRRVVRISFTASGNKTFEAANDILKRRVTHVLSAFTTAERGQFLGFMDRLADVLEQEAAQAQTAEGAR